METAIFEKFWRQKEKFQKNVVSWGFVFDL